ncbi:hypothetical protein [Paraburkholderia tuberum]|uniref:Uncharacterized protein n=1 Tax=Paraburkholderia tuberum TaxID=157910 RepID=A0A1H1JAL0_9BURK|nr:hypothetical protein [Paraburkholderia tuberum]SDR47019.1 hypothetical protein SAMN05445850_4497 [Paraburkholderia tuberum]
MTANATAICNSFKIELLKGFHAFNSDFRTADTFKAALYTQNQGMGAGTTAYTTAGEVSGSGYTAGGVPVTFVAPALSGGSSAVTTPTANIVFPAITIASPFDCALVYNASQGNRAVGVYAFAAQSINNADMTLIVPADGQGQALVEID